MNRRDKETEVRKGYVLDAARLVLERKGVEGTSMEEIAEAAEYTRRTLYSYFKGRDEILLLLHMANNAERLGVQADLLRDSGAGLDSLRAWAHCYFEYVRARPAACELQMYWDFRGVDAALLSPETFTRFRSQNEEMAAQLRAVLEQCRADGSLRSDVDIEMCMSQLLYSLRGVFNRAISDSYSFADFDAGAYVAQFVDVFVRGIARPSIQAGTGEG